MKICLSGMLVGIMDENRGLACWICMSWESERCGRKTSGRVGAVNPA